MKGIKFILAAVLALLYSSLLLGCGGSSPEPEQPGTKAQASAKMTGRDTGQNGAYASTQSQKSSKDLQARRSPAPVAADHLAFLQLVDQAGEHWREMAIEVAERVLKAYNDRDDLLDRPVFIAQPNNRPFSVAFYNLLRTELVSRGLQVSYSQEPRSAFLEYSVQTVPFDAGRRDHAIKTGKAKASDNEIIVNARMSYRNRFVMHSSSIRYINEKDLALYVDPQVFDPMASSNRVIRVSDK